ncbi:uncharacterized protein Ecym_2525 [Eremothecium cymbalariae DBVPG|uniref:Zinc finger C2H2 LYAR-type domain-containing protein n=1 Tax=Eremothecium cymbalariae (strain CBS 270.75 / DBVPG 7215 / KCTC 17166 / NRRL Y-17582) TaxID=931890 RepID=G8JQ88_ERECY|nr:Hypothetical protein Ecym_2525 [Eremothecium cymbalariae DBVPG\
MVTFNCEVCNATVPKKGTEKHYNRCREAYYTCIDCNTTFEDGVGYKMHTQCITEDEKYQKGLYKGKGKGKKAGKQKPVEVSDVVKHKPVEVKVKEKKTKISAGSKFELTPGQSLYKIMKTLKNKDDKKELLKKLEVTKDGHIVLKN